MPNYRLKRVFYSAYVPVVESSLLPSLGHQAAAPAGAPALSGGLAAAVLWVSAPRSCWTRQHPNFDPQYGPEVQLGDHAIWSSFPVEVMRADYETLLRVPGIGPISAQAHRLGPPHRPPAI